MQTIRRATEEDAQRMLALEQVFPNSMTDTMLLRELEVGVGYVLLDDEADAVRVVGYALVRQDKDLLDLTRLAIEPGLHGRGYGRFLLSFICASADAEGRALILTVLKDNHRAILLYLRAGFRVVGHYVREHAWAMRRDVPGAAHPTRC
jgi:ribosomal protein S18 acetylase RimI-like enzyme